MRPTHEAANHGREYAPDASDGAASGPLSRPVHSGAGGPDRLSGRVHRGAVR